MREMGSCILAKSQCNFRLLCHVRVGIDPCCFDLGLEIHSSKFFKVSKKKFQIRSQRWTEKKKNCCTLQTGAGMHFTGFRCTLILLFLYIVSIHRSLHHGGHDLLGTFRF